MEQICLMEGLSLLEYCRYHRAADLMLFVPIFISVVTL